MTRKDLLAAYESGIRSFKNANLQNVNLQGAVLQNADLQGANLQDADLRGADLKGTVLQDANLQNADLRDAGLQGANLGPCTPDQLVLREEVARQIEREPETYNQSEWHSNCGTKHCVAGWTVIKAGPGGVALEKLLGTSKAAHFLLGGKIRPSFEAVASREEILRDLRAEG